MFAFVFDLGSQIYGGVLVPIKWPSPSATKSLPWEWAQILMSFATIEESRGVAVPNATERWILLSRLPDSPSDPRRPAVALHHEGTPVSLNTIAGDNEEIS